MNQDLSSNDVDPVHQRSILIFCILVLLPAIPCALIPSLNALYMFLPAVATVLTLLITRPYSLNAALKHLGLTRLGLKQWLPALLIPIVVLTAGYGLVWTLNLARGSIPLSELKPGNTAIYFFGLVILNTLVFSLGEEIGWRGFLQRQMLGWPRLTRYIVIGLIWAVWHYPLLLLTQSYQAEGNRVIITALFTLTLIPLSIIIGELRERGDSVWPASLFHSSHNVAWGLLASFTLTTSPAAPYLAGESGLVPLVLYFIVAMIYLRRAPFVTTRTEAISDRRNKI